jgi:hypothetical protein
VIDANGDASFCGSKHEVENMMKYRVTGTIASRVSVDVDATTIEDALEAASNSTDWEVDGGTDVDSIVWTDAEKIS